jgi:hypothetical protein
MRVAGHEFGDAHLRLQALAENQQNQESRMEKYFHGLIITNLGQRAIFQKEILWKLTGLGNLWRGRFR